MDSFDLLFYDTVGTEFNPDSVKNKALGGSEFVLWQLADEFGKRGLRIMLWFGRGQARGEKICGNVVYRYGAATYPVNARHLFHHRYSDFAYEPQNRWGRRWFFCSDFWGNHYEEVLNTLKASLSGTICVSQWQASTFPCAGDCRILPNPIPAEAYESVEVPRDPNVFVYASAALKGLRSTLETWAAFRNKYPELRETRLRVLSPGYDDPSLAAAHEGVELVGAVPFPTLLDELRRAAGIFYVNDYPETFCIVAALAEACGARVHIWMRNGGAIRETVNSPLLTADGTQFESDFVKYYRSVGGQGCTEPHDFSTPHVVDRWRHELGI